MACLDCGLQWQCLCDQVPLLTSEVMLSLLTHENEYQRATNTGRWLVRALTNAQDFPWQRGHIPTGLLERLNDPRYYSLLMYPSEDSLALEEVLPVITQNHQQPHFIILDGTWQEAKKIWRKSPWLNMPQVHLSGQYLSNYQLRRNQQTGHLCTLEVGSELIKQTGAPAQATALTHFLTTFSHTLQADKSGHRLR